jgi:N-ethylmaleimide reductase
VSAGNELGCLRRRERDEIQPLLRPDRMGEHRLANRVVMAPLTCWRATNPDLAPTELHARSYAHRASAGLIVAEGTWISPDVG